jgi:hypothetical protein
MAAADGKVEAHLPAVVWQHCIDRCRSVKPQHVAFNGLLAMQCRL